MKNVKKAPSATGKEVQKATPNAETKAAAVIATKASKTANERLNKFEVFKSLSDKYQQIDVANTKLKKFQASTHKAAFKLKLSNEAGEVFETQNETITEAILGLIGSKIQEMRENTEFEILEFDI